MMPVVNVKLMDLDTMVHEVVTKNSDGSYTIIINSRFALESQKAAYLHAIGHIENDDFEKDDVQQIEAEAHRRNPICGCSRSRTAK